MRSPSRRDFLKASAAFGGALFLSPWNLRAAAPTDEVDMSIARLRASPDAAEVGSLAGKLTERAIEAIGGMGRFVSKGDRIWIKPNIGWNRAPETAANTNPDVVSTLIRLCLDAGAKKVKVGDHTCHEARLSYRTSGIESAARETGAEVVFLDEKRFRSAKLGGERLREWPVYPEIVDSDLVINVPVVKHHGLSRATIAMKNYMGVVGGRRDTWHQDLPSCLVDITAYMKPRLTVVDAVRILTANGPQGGNLADVAPRGIVAAGTDIVALDAFGAEILGHDPREIATIRAAHEAGLGTIDYRSLRLREVSVS